MGFLPPTDDRVHATVLAIADELTEDGFVLRYRTDTTDTGFAGKEGTFTICSFWLVSALAMIGEVHRASALCEKLLSFAGPLGLYAEEIDTTTGAASRQLPPGVHPPRAHRGGVAAGGDRAPRASPGPPSPRARLARAAEDRPGLRAVPDLVAHHREGARHDQLLHVRRQAQVATGVADAEHPFGYRRARPWPSPIARGRPPGCRSR